MLLADARSVRETSLRSEEDPVERADRVRSGYREYYAASRPRLLEQRARLRAQRLGVVAEELDYLDLYARDSGRCYLCGAELPVEVASWDHVVALARGGPHIAENVRVAHILCNARKSDRDLDELTGP